MAEGGDRSAQDIHQPSKKTKSEVWAYFGFLKNAEGQLIEDDYPVCRTCRKKVSAKGSNTSNLMAHLRDNHPRLYSQCKRGAVGQTSRQRSTATGSSVTQTLEQAFQKQTDYVPASQKAQELTAAIAYLIAKDMMPFRIVERPGFLRMMKVAVPHYKVPTRNYFSKTEIPKMYNAVKADVKKSLAQGEFFAATTDFWTSERGGGLPYISFTVHYLTPDWQLESHCLETQFFPEVHSAQNIAEFFENMLEEWEINKTDLVSITTDNAANMTKAFEEFPDVWLGCFGHNLNLAISKALKIQRVETAVRTCRHLVQGFSRSWKRKRGLREKQAALTLPPLALIHDVVTRWGSTYKMLERFISQQQAVCATLAAERGAWHLMPKDTDIIVMEQVCQLLEPLSKFTDALCSETRVTLSAIKPVLDHITGDVLEENEAEPALTKQMKHAMREDLNNRYTEKAKDVMQMACFIDPRFKNNFLDAPVDDVVDRCVQEALKLTPVQVKQEPQSTSSNSTAAAGGKGLAGLLKKITSTRQQRSEEGSGPATPEDKVKEEVKVYMSLPSIPADDDPLVWWRGHASELPHLARLAKKLLCIPATSVPSERIFSASGHILSSLRSHLKPEKVNMLTFLHFNLK